METRENVENGRFVLYVSGEIDGTNVDEFETALNTYAEKTDYLILDLNGLDYVSSAGLRSFLMLQKSMTAKGNELHLRNVTDEVMDIFNVTGFSKLLHID